MSASGASLHIMLGHIRASSKGGSKRVGSMMSMESNTIRCTGTLDKIGRIQSPH